MSEKSIVHEQLKEAAAAFLKEGGQVQYRLLQEEVFHLIQILLQYWMVQQVLIIFVTLIKYGS